MERRKLRLLYLLYLRRKRKCRGMWVHPINEDRTAYGAFRILYQTLRKNRDKFFNFYRMSIETFDELLRKLEPHLKKSETNMRDSIKPVERLAITLRYLATGNSMHDLHYYYKIGVSTVSQIVDEVCTAIWTVLKEECIPKPSVESFEETARGFEKRAQFPNCIGAVDGKHIKIIKPAASGSLFFNYKSYFSIVLMAVVDSEYRFTFVDIGAYGKDADPTIFGNTSFWKAIQSEKIKLPEPKPLPGTQEAMPYVFVGDEAFSLHEHMMRPFGGRQNSITKRVFNYRLTVARRFVECAFGILSNKWRIFHRPLNVSVDHAKRIVQACCVLHNFVRERDGYRFDHTLFTTGLEDLPRGPFPRNQGNAKEKSVRMKYAEYFMSEEGSVKWQLDKI